MGVQRPRINESCMDPELLAMDLAEASKILDLWKMDGAN
jgi:hypothetical protein